MCSIYGSTAGVFIWISETRGKQNMRYEMSKFVIKIGLFDINITLNR